MNINKITRDLIIKKLVDSLEPIDYLYAFWEGGAAAFNRIDQWSDIDLYLVVDDERIKDAIKEFEKALNSVSPIEQKYEIKQRIWPEMFQAFYKIKDASRYLLIDLVIMKFSSPEKFLEPKLHGNAVFYFKKSSQIRSEESMVTTELISKSLSTLKDKFDLFNIFVQKEINRGNSLEAIDVYYNITIASLVEVLRIKHNPSHHKFKMRYVHYELPIKIVEKLEYHCFFNNLEELQEKYNSATKWFYEIIYSLSN